MGVGWTIWPAGYQKADTACSLQPEACSRLT
jgi:hypothetical protein